MLSGTIPGERIGVALKIACLLLPHETRAPGFGSQNSGQNHVFSNIILVPVIRTYRIPLSREWVFQRMEQSFWSRQERRGKHDASPGEWRSIQEGQHPRQEAHLHVYFIFFHFAIRTYAYLTFQCWNKHSDHFVFRRQQGWEDWCSVLHHLSALPIAIGMLRPHHTYY